MSYLDIFNQRNNAYGSTIRDNLINSTKRNIIDSFYDSPSYYQVDVYTPSTPLSSTPLDSRITDDSDIKDQKNIIAHPNQTLNKGYLIYWKSKHWLTVQSDEDFGDTYSRGTIKMCIGSLKWLNSTSVTKEAYFTMAAPTGTNFGTQDGKIINLGNERRQIIIQKNEDTSLLRKDDRFIFDDRAWIITAIDGLNDGLIYLTLDEDTSNSATDNIASRIADETGTSAGGFW